MIAGLQASVQAWSARAIHDSLAAIVAQHPYDRSLRRSLMDRLFDWIDRMFHRVLDALGDVPYGRWVILGAAIVVLAAIIARSIYVASTEDRERAARGLRRGRAIVADPWAEAQQLATAGRLTEAAHSLYRALLEILVQREQLRLHPAKTSGDYSRELRARNSPLWGPFRQFGRRYDRVLFGHAPCDAASYVALLNDAAPLLEPRARP
jgi:hypothetical protein